MGVVWPVLLTDETRIMEASVARPGSNESLKAAVMVLGFSARTLSTSERLLWMQQVAKEIPEVRHSVFIVSDGQNHDFYCFDPRGDIDAHSDVTFAAAAAVMWELNYSDDVVTFNSGGRTQKVRRAGEVVVTEGVLGDAQFSALVTERGSVATPSELTDAIAGENEETLYHLVQQLRSPLGVIPFVGAGLSAPLGYPQWGEFLRRSSPPTLKTSIAAALKNGDYEGAAEKLKEYWGDDQFQNKIEAAFGDLHLEDVDFGRGPLGVLPHLAPGPVITTNFDRALEHAFREGGRPFEDVVSGPRPDLTVRALHRNRHVLLKIHGDFEDREFRSFTTLEYDENYGEADDTAAQRTRLSSLSWLVFTNRPLLFLGASLEQDRTVTILSEIHKKLAGVTHFAILAARWAPFRLEERRRNLRDCGISPLWFPPGAFHRIEELLGEVLRRAAVKPLRLQLGAVSPPREGHDTSEWHRNANTRLQAALTPATTAAVALPSEHFDRVVPAIRAGRIVFFLGSAVNEQSYIRGGEFYARLARIFGCPEFGMDRTAIAQYIADRYGREQLYEQIEASLKPSPSPTLVHWFLAGLPGTLAAAGGKPRLPLIVTSNQDDVLENALDLVGAPFELFIYQASGKHRGRFIHRDPAGALSIIQRPAAVRGLSPDAFTIVKLNGSVGWRGELPSSYVTTKRDFWDLAAQIPDVFPAGLRNALEQSSLLFLGHGLHEPDVDALVRYVNRDIGTARSWAVKIAVTDAAYWEQCGLELMESDVFAYVAALQNRLGPTLPNGLARVVSDSAGHQSDLA